MFKTLRQEESDSDMECDSSKGGRIRHGVDNEEDDLDSGDEDVDLDDEEVDDDDDEDDDDEVDDDDDDSEADNDENQKSWSHWKILITEAVEEMGKQPSEAAEILKDPYFDDFIEKVRESLSKQIRFADYVKRKDKVFNAIQKSANLFIREMKLSKGEAFEKAWNERKYLLKRFLRNHLEEIQDEVLNNGGSDTEEIDDENESETEASDEDITTHQSIEDNDYDEDGESVKYTDNDNNDINSTDADDEASDLNETH